MHNLNTFEINFESSIAIIRLIANNLIRNVTGKKYKTNKLFKTSPKT